MSTGEADRILAVQNPVCSLPEVAEQVVGWLMDSRWGSNLEVLKTRDPDEGSNVDLIRDALEPGTVAMVLSGDGIGNDTFNAIKLEDEAGRIGADEVSLLAVPTGNGNDFSSSMYRGNILRRRGRQLWGLLERGDTTWVDGMKLESDDGHLDRYAYGYFSIGFVAQSAAAINQPDFRERRAGTHLPVRALDTYQVLRALKNRQAFGYENGSGETRQAQEMILAIIPRIAAGVIRLDTDPLDGEVVSLELGSKGFIPKAVGKVVSGRFGGAKAETVVGDHHKMTLRTPAAIQYDGEPDELQAGTTVSITHHREIVRALV